MHNVRRVASAAAVLLLIGAIATELRKRPEQRERHGEVAGAVPYDFRLPTRERLRQAYWNPDGGTVSPMPIGVGWTLNLGRLARLAGLT